MIKAENFPKIPKNLPLSNGRGSGFAGQGGLPIFSMTGGILADPLHLPCLVEIYKLEHFVVTNNS